MLDQVQQVHFHDDFEVLFLINYTDFDLIYK